MSVILDCIVEIGLNVVRESISTPLQEAQVRKRLHEYLEKQKKLNFGCTKEEEIDFQQLAEYIQNSLPDDIKRRLFGDKDERTRAHRSILEKAVQYSQSNTRISNDRAKSMVNNSIVILRKYYESKTNRNLLFLAGRIEDTIVEVISEQHRTLCSEIQDVKNQISDNSLLSLDNNLTLARKGRFDEVEKNLSTALAAVSSIHPLNPYYGFTLDRRNGEFQLLSTPLIEEATTKYPTSFSVTASSLKVGHIDVSEIQGDIFAFSYRHQKPIEIDVIAAKKLLGSILDPIQVEAQEMEGSKVHIYPPQFPKAFPCSLSINDKCAFEYLLLRTKELMEDGTVIITNEEQKNRPFDVKISINQQAQRMHFTFLPKDSTNAELLVYRKFIRDVSRGGKFKLKLLSSNSILGSGKADAFTISDSINREIELLEKIVAIENHFCMSFVLPNVITHEDYHNIDHLHKLIAEGSFCGHWSAFNISLKICDATKQNIMEMGDTTFLFSYTCLAEVELFGQMLSFSMKRELQNARFEDYNRIKEKLEVLDIGDIISIPFVPDETKKKSIFTEKFIEKDI